MTHPHDRVERERQFHDSLIREGHNTIATKEWWETPGGKVRFARRISLLNAACANLITPPQRARVLVVGCGEGEWINAISDFAEVAGIDISPEIITRVGSQLRNITDARVEVGDAHQLRFADESFDICFANSTLHHLDLQIALPELHRVLRSGGLLIAGEPNRTNPQVWWMYRFSRNRSRYGLTPDEEAFSRKSIHNLLCQYFCKVSVSPFDFWHPALGHTDSNGCLFRFLQSIERVPIVRSLAGSLWIVAEK
jgi:SAM-dependent methyltransferase